MINILIYIDFKVNSNATKVNDIRVIVVFFEKKKCNKTAAVISNLFQNQNYSNNSTKTKPCIKVDERNRRI